MCIESFSPLQKAIFSIDSPPPLLLHSICQYHLPPPSLSISLSFSSISLSLDLWACGVGVAALVFHTEPQQSNPQCQSSHFGHREFGE